MWRGKISTIPMSIKRCFLHVEFVKYLIKCQLPPKKIMFFDNIQINSVNLRWLPQKIFKCKYLQNHKSFLIKINTESMAIVLSITSQLASSWKLNASSWKPKVVLKTKRIFKIYSIVRPGLTKMTWIDCSTL